MDVSKVFQELENEYERRTAAAAILNPETRRRGLRDFYRLALPEITAAGRAAWGIDPYEVDWLRVFTPIEESLWHDIRAAGMVMYPQFPVLGFFVDFGNPVAKVAIECDGVAFHQDKQKDHERQRAIQSAGWSIYRISGRDCKTDSDPETGEPGAAGRFIRDIAEDHGIGRGSR